MRRAFETIESIDNDSNMIITLIKKIKVFVKCRTWLQQFDFFFWLKGSITIWFWVLLRVNLLLNNTRYSPAELVGMLDSNGAMKKESLSPDNIYVWFVIVPVPLITWMIMEKWVMKSVSLPVLLFRRHTCTWNEARPTLELTKWVHVFLLLAWEQFI